MPAEGGPARRMTWLGPDVMVRGWTREGHILFVTTHGQPFFRNYRAFTLDPAGGLPQLLPLGQVNHLAFGPGGAKLIGRNTADPARWKRYRGGTAGHFWIDADGGGEFRRMTELPGNLTSPMWIGERIWYLSDAEGVGNLYSCGPDGTQRRRHTDHDDYYARLAQTDGRRIVYQCGADLWLFDPATDRTAKIDVRVPAHRTQAARRFVAAADNLGEFALHPAGHSVAVDVRGKIFTFGLWEGAVRQWGAVDGARYRHPQWLADGSDADRGRRRLAARSASRSGATARRTTLPWDVGRVVAMRAAPCGTRVAIANHRNEVLIGDVGSGSADHGRSQRPRPHRGPRLVAGRRLARLLVLDRSRATARSSSTTSPRTARCWPRSRSSATTRRPSTPRAATCTSCRCAPSTRSTTACSSSCRSRAPPALPDRAAGGRPAAVRSRAARTQARRGRRRGRQGRQGQRRRRRTGDAGPGAGRPAGLARRVAAFPVPEGRFGQIAGVAGGKVVWTMLPDPRRARPRRPQGRPGTARAVRLRDRPRRDADRTRPSASCSPRTRIDAAAARRQAAARDSRATASPSRDKARGSDAPSRKSGWLDLERIRVSVDPRGEWRQMLREVWRLQRDHFWTADMSGVDWDAVFARYEPLLARVATRSELSDLIWEMQGELGTSHAYEMGGDHRKPPPVHAGPAGGGVSRRRRRQRLRDRAHRHRRPLGRGRGLAAERRRRRGEGRRAHRRGQRPAGVARDCRRRRCSCTRRAARSS